MTTIIRNENAEGRSRSVFSAFLDMKKAFDRIDRDLLNYKLLSVGINGETESLQNGLMSKMVSEKKGFFLSHSI